MDYDTRETRRNLNLRNSEAGLIDKAAEIDGKKPGPWSREQLVKVAKATIRRNKGDG
jgi:uncharacterized protein (DUF1778 family)